MNMRVRFPGGKRVDVDFDGHTVQTDQPVDNGGENTAAAPYDLFLASIATCAGIYVVGFCNNRGVDPGLVQIDQRVTFDPESKLASKIDLDLTISPDFPEKYVPALIRVVEQCKVKKSLALPPTFSVNTLPAPVQA
ncbi:OsmC family protein [Myxococcota bacterium]|nr:OsmC family protein [Myxococcota bacterium]